MQGRPMLIFEITQGTSAGQTLEVAGDEISIGRALSNHVVLADEHVSGEHARIVYQDDSVTLMDLESTNGTAVVRAGERTVLRRDAPSLRLEVGDIVEFGTGDSAAVIRLLGVDDSDDAQVMSVRSLDDLAPAAEQIERDPGALSKLYAVQKRIGTATDLDAVLVEIADGALQLIPQATHVTLILRDDDEGAGHAQSVFVPVMTRVRLPNQEIGAPSGPVPITRSVYRKVIKERAAVLASDAPRDVGQSESLMGASIRSTVGVPLWKGDEIIGVIQVDNRNAPFSLNARDLEKLLVLASNASLAVANARLIKRLTLAEDRLRKENTFLKGREERRRVGSKEGQIIGKSEPIKKILESLAKVVDTRVTVLIEGETGTGKELIASAVHYQSKRRDRLFVAQNCAAIAETLLESELFGHKRGSFTGATDDKKGLFELADGGTLFLDEITEAPVSIQSKLLRALQEGEIRPVGAAAPKYVNVRIVAATNRNLEEEVEAGRFRQDLYYRLKVFPIRLPPLRERPDDIPMLAAHFLERYSAEIGKAAAGFAQQAMELMVSYPWPGNVRELQNEVQRLVIQIEVGAFVTADLLSPRIRQVEGLVSKAGVSRGSLREMMDTVEKYFLLEALREQAGNKTNAAKTLGITREGLHKKLRQFGMS